MRSITIVTLVLLALLALPFVPTGATGAVAQAASAPTRVWIQLSGAVEKVQGDWMMFKLDDGRRVATDISSMSSQERALLVAGARTTLYGYTDQRIGRFVAFFLPVESAPAAPAASAPPASSPSAAADTRPWRLVHGRVGRVDAEGLTLVTDSGRTINVDLRGVEASSRAAISGGDDVTVAGFHSGDFDQVDARFVHQDAIEAGGPRAEAQATTRVR